MATRTSPSERRTDAYGVERHNASEPGAIDKVRQKAPVIDRLMRMNERFGEEGGNQFAAGITYFSVMAIFPLAMLTFAVLGFVLAGNPDLLSRIQDQISGGLPSEAGTMVNQIIEQAIDQRGAIAGVGALTALWSGLGWMNNLRVGISAMWKLDPTEGGNFVVKKLKDLVGLIGLLFSLFIAFGVTALGSSGLTSSLLERLGVEGFPGMNFVIFAVGLIVGIFANFLVFAWLLIALPRTKVPHKSGIKAAIIGAFIFEVIKQLSTLIFGSLMGNPAGAVFGPIIGLMLIMYLIWRVVLYLSAFAATTKESLAVAPVRAPDPAVIHVRNEVRESNPGTMIGLGAAVGAIGAGLAAWMTANK